MAGLKVMKGLLRTSALMNKQCITIGQQAASAKVAVGEGRGLEGRDGDVG